MAPVSWKTLTSSRLASFKDYVAQKDYKATYDALSSRVRGNRDDGAKQSWDQWARQTLGRTYGSSEDTLRVGSGVERVQLFPGWAVRRYKDPSKIDEDGAEFSLDVFVSGFASSVRPPEAATRSQKAFYRLAKGYAALPKLPTVSTPSADRSQDLRANPQRSDMPSNFDLSKLPPTPTEITDETELEALEAQFREISAASQSSSSTSSSYGSDDGSDSPAFKEKSPRDETPKGSKPYRSNSYGLSDHIMEAETRANPSTPVSMSRPNHPAAPQPNTSLPEQVVDYAVQKLHANLDARLQPFWSSAVPNRVVRLSVFCPQSGHAPSETHDAMEGQDTDPEPLATKDVITSPQGAFQTTFYVPWERLATHPPTLHIAFGDPAFEYPVVVQAEMWAPSPTSSSASSSPSSSMPYMPYQRNNASRSHPQLPSTFSLAPSASQPQSIPPILRTHSIRNRITVPLSIPRVPLRLISDIDDTIKHSGVLSGAKSVFQNVFVRHLHELVIPSMVEWYRTLWQKGVRFHYVSNSPFELLPVLTEFFQVSSLPEGSIKLKSYAARSLLPALLSPPAVRKRQGVVEVLDAFPECHFVLVGDTGEQDMELYAELARERPRQVVGVFVRNVTTSSDQDPDPMQSIGGQGPGTVNGALNAQFGGSLVDQEPGQIKAMSSMESRDIPSARTASDSNMTAHRPPPLPSSHSYFSHSHVASVGSTSRLPGTLPRRKSSTGMTPEERRRYDLEARIQRARAEIPSHTAFRVFREPHECAEVQDIVEHLMRDKNRR